jgi:RNA polymerase sigma factor (sigma-70 family)
LEADAEKTHRIEACPAEGWEMASRHMPDEVTRDCARRMHYAAHRTEQAGTASQRDRWERRYLALRDCIILGNRKLIFRAVQKWKVANYQAEDLIGECDLVLIRVVATYNPWLGIRFSTFAFTCLMRALSRLWAKTRAEQNSQSLFREHLAVSDVFDCEDAPPANQWELLEGYLRDEHTLLSDREKIVLKRRYGIDGQRVKSTLEALGRDLSLSKERIRQLEKSALDKLRRTLNGTPPSERSPCGRFPGGGLMSCARG